MSYIKLVLLRKPHKTYEVNVKWSETGSFLSSSSGYFRSVTRQIVLKTFVFG